ncbi:MAG: translocation/assembly module TamB domain-containing protein [Bacteroidales bacterium]|nr:translocation/assembly module TamB domain-containing protein [Bacteroidales bacterium]
MKKTTNAWITYVFRLLIGIVLGVAVLLFVTGVAFMIPSVQTGAAQKAAAYLSREMQTDIRIGKLRVDWNLDILLKEVEIQDLHQETMIAFAYARTHFPSYSLKNNTLQFQWMTVKEATVRIANYQGEQGSNLSFFINYFKSDHPHQKEFHLLIQNVRLENSRFAFFNERHPREYFPNTWNYSDIRFYSINCNMRTLAVENALLLLDIDHLSFQEQSGFEVQSLKGKVSVGSDRIYCEEAFLQAGGGTDASLDFRFDFNNYAAFSDFYDSVFFRCQLRPSKVAWEDIQFFVPAFAGMEHLLFHLQGDVNRSLSNLAMENLFFQLNNRCLFAGDIYTHGLPDAAQTDWDLRLSRIAFCLDSLQHFILPLGERLQIPSFLEVLQCTSGNLKFTGRFSEFQLETELQSNMGAVEAVGAMRKNEIGMQYTADFGVRNLALSSFLHTSSIDQLTASGHIHGNAQNIEDYSVNIQNLQLNGTPIHQTQVEGDLEDGRLTVQCRAADPLLQATLKGFVDLQENHRPCYATFDIQNMATSALKLFRPDSNTAISCKGNLQMNLTGLDALEGSLNIEEACYKEQLATYPLNHISISLKQKEKEKVFLLFSEALQMRMRGNVPLSQIVPFFKEEAHRYLPQTIAKNEDNICLDSFHLQASAKIRENQSIMAVLLPSFQCQQPVEMNAAFTSDSVTVMLNAPSIQLNKNEFENLEMNVSSNGDTLNLAVLCHQLIWNRSDSLSNMEQLRLTASACQDTVPFRIRMRKSDNRPTEMVDLVGVFNFNPSSATLCFQEGKLCFDKELFRLDSQSRIRFEKEHIQIDQLKFASETQSFSLHGNYSKTQPMRLQAEMSQVDLGELAWLMQPYKIAADGIANGNFALTRTDNLQFISHLKVDQFVFNDVHYGALDLQTQWIDYKQMVDIKADVRPSLDDSATLHMKGNYHPNSKQIDLKGDIYDFNLKSIAPFLTSFSSEVQGNASGVLHFSGPLQKARLNGDIFLKNADLRIDYLQTKYHISQQHLLFEDSGFVFKDVQFVDDAGNKGSLNGIVSHQQLKNWGVQLDVDAQHLMVLNTQYKDNDLFFGRAYATGRVHLSQIGSLFSVQGNVRTESPTYITLSLTRNTNVQMQNNYIVFERPYTIESEAEKKTEHTTGKNQTQLLLNLTATPDATVKVNLDPSIGCTLIGNGNGNLRLELNEKQKFEIYGSYTLSEGTVDLALGNILTRSLKLENGSDLSWDGRPESGKMNVKATYTTKTSISNLLNESATSSYRTIPMTTCLHLNGNLLNPDFDFSIRMDEVDESIQSVVYNVLDTTDKEEMLQQAFALMLTGRLNVEQSGTNAVNYGIGYSLSELSSYYLQKMISSITDKVNLGFQYIQGDGSSTADEYNVQISTNLMENRLSIQGNLNIYGDNGFQEEQAVAGNVVGDIIFEYKITKDGSLRIKAFNLANYYDVLSSAYSDVPYYQGVGIAFSKDFNHLKDLFKRK